MERLKWTGNIKFKKRRLICFSRKFDNKADYFGSEILKVPDFNLSNFEHFEMFYFKWSIITFQNIPWYFLSCARCCTNRNIYFGQSRTVKSWFHKKRLIKIGLSKLYRYRLSSLLGVSVKFLSWWSIKLTLNKSKKCFSLFDFGSKPIIWHNSNFINITKFWSSSTV